jgi:3'-5' exoribonuclease
MARGRRIVALADLEPGTEGEFFAVLASKEELKTREGKPYYRVAFRDARRQVGFPIWSDSRWGKDCRDRWVVGRCYRIRAVYRETSYGPELDIREIREYCAEEDQDFSPELVFPHGPQAPDESFAKLRALVVQEIGEKKLQRFVLSLLDENQAAWCRTPGSLRHQFAYAGGLVEHTLRVTENAVLLARKYAERAQEPKVAFDPELVIAGAVLHDIGKLVELEGSLGTEIETAAGGLLGHLVLGRDLIREAAGRYPIDTEQLLRLEHIILSHHGEAEFGSPKPPMTLEALLVRFANEVDVRFELACRVLSEKSGEGPFTSERNVFRQRFYRGGQAAGPPQAQQ